jgi:hypothetical protein
MAELYHLSPICPHGVGFVNQAQGQIYPFTFCLKLLIMGAQQNNSRTIAHFP